MTCFRVLQAEIVLVANEMQNTRDKLSYLCCSDREHKFRKRQATRGCDAVWSGTILDVWYNLRVHQFEFFLCVN